MRGGRRVRFERSASHLADEGAWQRGDAERVVMHPDVDEEREAFAALGRLLELGRDAVQQCATEREQLPRPGVREERRSVACGAAGGDRLALRADQEFGAAVTQLAARLALPAGRAHFQQYGRGAAVGQVSDRRDGRVQQDVRGVTQRLVLVLRRAAAWNSVQALHLAVRAAARFEPRVAVLPPWVRPCAAAAPSET